MKRFKYFIKTALVGLLTGFANGLFGAGGGTIAVPSMQKFLGVDTHKSHATAISVILPLSVVSLFVYSGNVQVDYVKTLFVASGGVVGGFVGARLLTKLSSGWLHKIFGIFMVLAALWLILWR